MAKDGSYERRRTSVPVATDSGKNSTSDPNIESLDWVTCKQEEQLDKFIRKKLDHLYGQVLFKLVYMGYDEDVALKGLLERGYCVGEGGDCLTNLVQNSLEFLTGKDDVESEEQDRPQPFKNLELLVDFNLHFMVHILQKYSPNLNRMSLLRCILMTDLNLNRAIIMNMPFDMTDMPSDLNLEDDDDNGEILDRFLALDNLNILDDSVSEDMKDAIIDDLKTQLKKRIRWANKKVAEARRKQPNTIMCLREELRLFEYSLESMFAKIVSELSSVNEGFDNAGETIFLHRRVEEQIKAEISASKLIESETEQKCLEVSKKKIWKWEQELVENDAIIMQAKVKMSEVNKARNKVIAVADLETMLALEKWDCWRKKVDSLTNIDEHMERLNKLVLKTVSYIRDEQDLY